METMQVADTREALKSARPESGRGGHKNLYDEQN